MTFSELMLKARRRLQDIRDASGVLITDASKDGIRWTSVLLSDVLIEGLHDFSRTLIGLKLTNHYNESAFNRIQDCTIEKVTGKVVFSVPERIYKVVRLIEVADRTAIYDYVSPDDFFSNIYRSSYVDEKFFTTVFDDNTKLVEGLVSKISVDNIAARAINKINLDDLYTIESTVELPFVNINDLILDYIEKVARVIEHNPTQAQVVNQDIQFKLGLLTNEGIKKR